MRWLQTLALLALAAWPAAAQEIEAEKLFRGMEKNIRAAKTLQLRFDASITTAGDKKEGNVKGTLILGEGDKLRAEAEGKVSEQELKFTVVSGGIDLKSFWYDKAPWAKQVKAETEKSAKGVGAYFRGALHRDGFFMCFLGMNRRSDFPFSDDLYKLSDFKLTGKEKIGERNTQAIQYMVTIKEEGKDKAPIVLSMKVWLDAKTNLPVRLAMTGGRSDITDITETYSEFTLDAKVDPKSLPEDEARKLAAAERSSLDGHTATINVLAFAPDGKTLASGSDDKTVRLWDVASGKERAVLPSPSGFVNSLTFSSDGKTLLWLSNAGTVTVWDLAAGKERVSFEVNKGRTMALTPDGKTLATAGENTGDGGDDGPTKVALWDAGTGKERLSRKGHLRRVNAVAFSPDGKTLASGSDDQTIRLWDVATGKKSAVLPGDDDLVWTGKGCIESLAFTPDGKTLVSGRWDGLVRLWDVAKGKQRLTLKGQEGLRVMAVAVTGNGKTLASGSQDVAHGGNPGRVILWDADTGKTLLSIEGGWGPVAISPDGKVLASVGGVDKKPVVKLWDVSEAPKGKTDR